MYYKKTTINLAKILRLKNKLVYMLMKTNPYLKKYFFQEFFCIEIKFY